MGYLKRRGLKYDNSNTKRGATDPSEELNIHLGDVAATTDFIVFEAPKSGSVIDIKIGVGTTVTANDTNYWTFSLVNLGAAGSGTDEIFLETSDADTTKATGGQTLTADTIADFAVSATPTFAKDDVLKLTLTKAASATTLDGAYVKIRYRDT